MDGAFDMRGTTLQMTGYSREEVIGRNCRFLQGPDTDRDTVARIREVVAAGGDLTVKVGTCVKS